MGVPLTVFVPASVDPAKLAGMRSLGAEVKVSAHRGFDQTEAWARDEARKLGLPLASAYEDGAVMAGNGGSLGVEVLEDLPQARCFVIPVSGGGMGAGLATVVKRRHPNARIIACQHEGSPSLARSLERGEAVTRMEEIDTLAGGLEGGIGVQNFEILGPLVDQVVLVSEEEIFRGVRWMLDAHQHLIEPSAAATVAACLSGRLDTLGKATVVVLSGRNVGLDNLRIVLGGAPKKHERVDGWRI